MVFADTPATKRFLKPPHLRKSDLLVLGLTSYKDDGFFKVEIIRGKKFSIGNHIFRPSNGNRILETADGGKVEIPTRETWPSRAATNYIQDIPENWRDEKDRYNYQKRRLAITDYTLAKLSVWPESQLAFEDELVKIFYTAEVDALKEATRRSMVQADFKLTGAMPVEIGGMLDNYLQTEEYPLSDYQKTAVALCLNRSYALFMEQGTGKTAVAISKINVEAAEIYRKYKMAMTVIVVCPNQVRLNWENEFEKFSTVSGKTSIIKGTKTKRFEQIIRTQSYKKGSGQAFAVAITSYDTFANDVDNYSYFPWDLVIYDESHSYKNGTTKRFKAVKKFRDLMNAHPSRAGDRGFKTLALTGTPVTNHALDLFSQLESLGRGKSGFVTWKGFKDFHAKYENVGQTATGGAFKKLVSLANIPLLKLRLSFLSFRITKEEAGLQLPDKVYDIHEVEMTKKQTDLYNRLATELFVEMEATFNGKTEVNSIEANSILTRLLRLTTITSGHVRFDDTPAPIQIDSTNPKVDALMGLLSDSEKSEAEKTIVWAIYREDIRVIKEALDLHNNNPARKGPEIGYVEYWGNVSDTKKAEAIERFNNDPYCKVFLANPASAGAGLNLLGYNPEKPVNVGITSTSLSKHGVEEINHTYTGHEIFFSQGWSMTQRSQAEDRAHRRGTKMPVRITDLVVSGTIDEDIRKRVQGKIENAETIQDLRKIHQSLRDAQ